MREAGSVMASSVWLWKMMQVEEVWYEANLGAGERAIPRGYSAQ